MSTTARREPSPELILAACDGDPRALDAVAFVSLPLVYNLVGWAVGEPPAIEAAVLATMRRVVDGIRGGELDRPEAYRPWLIAIALRQSDEQLRTNTAAPDAAGLRFDFASRTIELLGLTEQRRDAVEATRWLDPPERELLALWWLEQSGHLERPELTKALGLTGSHTAGRMRRVEQQLDIARGLIPALHDAGNCPSLQYTGHGWDGVPNPLWRNQFARHVRDCPACSRHDYALIPLAGLLRGLPPAPVPETLRMATANLVADRPFGGSGPDTVMLPVVSPDRRAKHNGKASKARPGGRNGAQSGNGARNGAQGGARGDAQEEEKRRRSAGPFMLGGVAVVAAAVAAYVLIPGNHPAATASTGPLAAPRTPGSITIPAATHGVAASKSPNTRPSKTPSQTPSTHAAASSASPSAAAGPGAPNTAAVAAQTSSRKGISAWTFSGDDQALAESGASWFYTWSSSNEGLSAPGVGFVPMIWGSGSVTSSALSQAEQSTSCGCLLGFNEPDNSGQSNMTPAQALSLWPQLMSTGLELGSPAVASGGADANGWLDQFMSGAQKDGYRVNFITLHWYGSDFDPSAAVGQLQSYIEAVYAKYRLPIWLTEFALISFANGGSQYPSESVQASFLTQATQMLDSLPYVQRYAWFALPATSGLPSTGLFEPGPVVTPVGEAFEEAR